MKWNLRSLTFQGRESCTPLPAGMGRLGEEDFLWIDVFQNLGREREVSLIKVKTSSDFILKLVKTFHLT